MGTEESNAKLVAALCGSPNCEHQTVAQFGQDLPVWVSRKQMQINSLEIVEMAQWLGRSDRLEQMTPYLNGAFPKGACTWLYSMVKEF